MSEYLKTMLHFDPSSQCDLRYKYQALQHNCDNIIFRAIQIRKFDFKESSRSRKRAIAKVESDIELVDTDVEPNGGERNEIDSMFYGKKIIPLSAKKSPSVAKRILSRISEPIASPSPGIPLAASSPTVANSEIWALDEENSSKVVKCTACTFDNPKDVKFCQVCGTELAITEWSCKACTAYNSFSLTSCQVCCKQRDTDKSSGSKLSERSPSSSSRLESKSKDKTNHSDEDYENESASKKKRTRSKKNADTLGGFIAGDDEEIEYFEDSKKRKAGEKGSKRRSRKSDSSDEFDESDWLSKSSGKKQKSKSANKETKPVKNSEKRALNSADKHAVDLTASHSENEGEEHSNDSFEYGDSWVDEIESDAFEPDHKKKRELPSKFTGSDRWQLQRFGESEIVDDITDDSTFDFQPLQKSKTSSKSMMSQKKLEIPPTFPEISQNFWSVEDVQNSGMTKLDFSLFKIRQLSEAEHRQLHAKSIQKREDAVARAAEKRSSGKGRGGRGSWRGRVYGRK